MAAEDADLLGMGSSSHHRTGSTSPPSNPNLKMGANVVELGAPLSSQQPPPSSSQQTKRRKSPAREMGRKIRTSLTKGGGGGRSSGGNSGEGGESRRGSQQSGRRRARDSQHSSRGGQHSNNNPRGSQNSQHSHQPHQQQQESSRPRRGAVSAPWAEMKNEIRRKSRDAGDTMRRRSRDAGETMRRISVNYGDQMRRRVSVDAGGTRRNSKGKQGGSSRNNYDNSDRSSGYSKKDNRLTTSEHQELSQLRDRGSEIIGRRKGSSDGKNDGRRRDNDDSGAVAKQGKGEVKAEGGGKKGGAERRLSQSLFGEKPTPLQDSDSSDGDGDGNRRDLLSNRRASLDSSLRELGDLKDAPTSLGLGAPAKKKRESAVKKEPKQTKRSSAVELPSTKRGKTVPNRRAMLDNRRGSLDSSVMNLQPDFKADLIKKTYSKDADKAAGTNKRSSVDSSMLTTGAGRRQGRARRASIDASMRLGGSGGADDMKPFAKASRRRSSSLDGSFNLDRSFEQAHRRVASSTPYSNLEEKRGRKSSMDSTDHSRRRSLSFDEVDARKKRDSLKRDAADDRKKRDSRENLLREHLRSDAAKQRDGQGDDGSVSVASRQKSVDGSVASKRSSVAIAKRNSEKSAASKRNSEKSTVSKRNSEKSAASKRTSVAIKRGSSCDQAKIDAAKKAWGDTHAQQGGKRGSSTKNTDDTMSGSANNSFDGDEEDDSGKTSASGREGKRRGCHLSRFACCSLCLCYLMSMFLFGGLGFWVHMEHFDDDDGGNGTSTEAWWKPNITMPEWFGDDEDGEEAAAQAKNLDGLPTGSPSYLPTAAPNLPPSAVPSFMPSTSFPTTTPTNFPTPTPSTSIQPTATPSDAPSSSPTGTPQCPEILSNAVPLDGLVMLRYDVIIFQDYLDGGGLLCASLEYSGGDAAWIGLAFSEASRDPRYGRKEAIIGLPGMMSSVAVATGGTATLGQQIQPLEGKQPSFANPAKYELPAGGIGDGYSGPSLSLLRGKQTLINASVSVLDPFAMGGIVTDGPMNRRTQMSFTKFLEEEGEIEIYPYGQTLLLYAVAPLDDDGEYDGNPEWKFTSVNFLQSAAPALKKGYVRKRKRRHSPS